jgi:RNA polymerase sigma-70 factor, ECF subfamily
MLCYFFTLGFIPMDDCAGLLEAVRKMDAEALKKVFDLYAPALYQYVFRHCYNAILTDQIVGNVFVKLLEQLSLGNGPNTNLRSYLYEIAYHEIVDEVRYSQRTAPIDTLNYSLPDGNNTSMTAEQQMLVESVLRIIQNDLTVDQRHIIILHYLESFTLKETALIVGKTVGSAKTIQNRAIARLRKALDLLEIDSRFASQEILEDLATDKMF